MRKYRIIGYHRPSTIRSWGIHVPIEEVSDGYIRHSNPTVTLSMAQLEADLSLPKALPTARLLPHPVDFKSHEPPAIVVIGKNWGDKILSWPEWAVEPMNYGVVLMPEFITKDGASRSSCYITVIEKSLALKQRDLWMRGARALMKHRDFKVADCPALRTIMFWTDSSHPSYHN